MPSNPAPGTPFQVAPPPDVTAQTPDGRRRAGPADDGEAKNSAELPIVRKPLPPNEFQRFVLGATGMALPVFGDTYFAGPAQTFAPLDRVPVPADYVLGPGDELYLRAWGNIDIDQRLVIDRNGQINIPRVGTLAVAGLKASDIHGHLNTQIGRVFKGFSLNVTLGQLRSIQVFVVGQARQPGTYTVGSLSTLVNAIFASGGPGANGSMRHVQLMRGNALVTDLDLYDFIVQGDKRNDARLQAGDVIVFARAGPRVAVLGSVDTAAVYEIKNGADTLGDLLKLAGGNRAQADLSTAQLERIDSSQPKAPRQVVKVSLPGDNRTLLRDGDVLTVFAVAPQFANAVTLRGNVAMPLRHPYTPGMRISDLIPEPEALIARDYYIRKNRLVQYTEERRTTLVVGQADEINWEYATIERLGGDRLTVSLLAFNLGLAVRLRDPLNDPLLQSGDVVTIFNNKDIRGPQSRGTRLVRVEGEVERPGVYQLSPGETLRAVVARAGGLTPQAYVYGLELSREEVRLRQRENVAAAQARLESMTASQTAFNTANRATDGTTASSIEISRAATQAQIARLGRIQPNGRIALELLPQAASMNDVPDVPLEHEDRISVPSKQSFVTVAGSVVNNNAFLWKAGRTAGDYIRIAGLDEGAEVDNAFILRADGTVNHSINARGWFGTGNIESQPLFPGDAVVVPNKLDYETWGRTVMRNLKDWSQLFANFGLGAAAIKTLR
jgi:protein involved in polysaccharide export with SLBB domain